MRSCRGQARLRGLRASAPNNKGRAVNDDKWKTSKDLVRKSSRPFLFNAVPSIIRLMTLVRETLPTGLAFRGETTGNGFDYVRKQVHRSLVRFAFTVLAPRKIA